MANEDGEGGEPDGTGPTPAIRPASRQSDADDERGGSASPLVFLVGLVLFLASTAAFVADLVTGHGVTRSLLANAASVVVLVWWAAADTLSDPDSRVASRSGAAGTALVLVGLYLLAAGVVVGLTSLVHGRLGLVPWYLGGGLLLGVVGVVVLPREAIRESALGDDGA